MCEPVPEMTPRYDPASVESRVYRLWQDAGLFHAEPGDGEPYAIVIPPPNVTGALHMGHALNNALQDILIRWRRMQGWNTLWMPGTDHAGIATQNVVERSLAVEGRKRQDLGREGFIEEVWKWKAAFGSRIVEQLKRLGSSCDWDRERFTMDEGLSRAVREAFVTLYERGLIFRGKYLINWCPRCGTALSDVEVDHEEREGFLWHIRYPLRDEPHLHLTVATTRPETMLGDTAVAVHPDDERYTDFVGEMLTLPILGREIPVIADDAVDPDFGTGAVKVTPAHDPNDFAMGLRHNLPQVNVMNEDGTMSAEAGPDYQGQDRFECREALVEELRLRKLLGPVEPHVLSVGHCYRCHTVIEPYLSNQWFVKTRPLAEEALKATREGRVTFHPPRWRRFYESWLENVRDWCISRQIWWGHRIPAWYCDDCGEITVAREDPAACAKCASARIRRDEDVLDTWFSSALWPFSTLGWPEETPELDFYYPTSTLVTDRGIIYFWVARMVMMGIAMLGREPFSHVYIHGTILDEEGRKMSKSLGNGIDPIVMIQGGVQEYLGQSYECDGYGADAVRYSLVMLSTEGQDLKLSPTRFEMGRNFANKVWNAARFVMINLDETPEDATMGDVTALEDRWILSRLSAAARATTYALEGFHFNEAGHILYDFTWRDFCDWYVELAKPRLRESRPGDPVRHVLAHVLDSTLRLLHPFLPFMTEEVWQRLKAVVEAKRLRRPGEAEWPDALIIAPWPDPDADPRDDSAESTMDLLQGLVRGVRNIRSKMNIPDRKPLRVAISVANEAAAQRLRGCAAMFCDRARVEQIEIGVGLPKPERSAAEVLGRTQLFVLLSDLVDLDRERDRLRGQIEKATGYRDSIARKLDNDNFTARAPAAVVERERERLAQAEARLETLRRNLDDIA